MRTLAGPFVANDQGDVLIYEDSAAMYASIEAIDASTMDFFDGEGRPIRVVIEGARWHLDENGVGDPEPTRLESILRNYFGRLPGEFADFSARANAVPSLEQLVQLRRELSNAFSGGHFGGLFKRRWG